MSQLSHKPTGMSVMCVYPGTPIVGGVILRRLCHADVHVDDVSLIGGGIFVSHEDIPFCGADALAPKELVSGVLLT